jgi:hypothetical protein
MKHEFIFIVEIIGFDSYNRPVIPSAYQQIPSLGI